MKPDIIGFFDPDNCNPRGIVYNGKATIWTDVYAFTGRLMDIEEIHGEATIQNQASDRSCFKRMGAARYNIRSISSVSAAHLTFYPWALNSGESLKDRRAFGIF